MRAGTSSLAPERAASVEEDQPLSDMQAWHEGPVRQLLLREARQHLSRGRQFVEQATRAKPADVAMLLDLGEAFLVAAAELLTEVASGRREPGDHAPAA